MARIRAALKSVRRLLRELGDEKAYERYLAARGVSHSPEEWRRFSQRRQGERFERPNCGC
jgi:hypothetical protein